MSAKKPTVTLEILSNLRCKAHDLSPKATRVLDEGLSMPIPGARFSPRMGRGGWDGKKHLFYTTTNTFPTGLLPKVQKLLSEGGWKFKVVDSRAKVDPAPDMSRLTRTMLKGIELRDYQYDAAKRALEAQRGILWLATNAGKTEVACAIIRTLKVRTLFIVGKKGLLTQARERMAKRFGTVEENIGIIGDGRYEPKLYTVATVQSLIRRMRQPEFKAYLKSVKCLIGDECHHAKATTWYKLINACPAQYRYGLSGTPFGSGNGLMVEAAFGEVVARVSNETLISLGVSAQPTIRMIEVDEPQIDDGQTYTWDEVYKLGITTNTHRNKLVAKHAVLHAKRGRPVLVLVRELWHGDLISRMLQPRCEAHDIRFEFVHGKMPISMVDDAKARFEAGKTQILIASPIFDEGVDVPAIRTLVIADGGKSIRAVLQKIGRGLRQKKGGDNVLDVVDFADLTHKWLAKHSQERLAIYEGEGFKITT